MLPFEQAMATSDIKFRLSAFFADITIKTQNSKPQSVCYTKPDHFRDCCIGPKQVNGPFCFSHSILGKFRN